MDNQPEYSPWNTKGPLMDADEKLQLCGAVAQNIRQTVSTLRILQRLEQERLDLYAAAKAHSPNPWREEAERFGLSRSLETFLPQDYFDAYNRPSFFDRKLADVGKWDTTLLDESTAQVLPDEGASN